MIAGRNPALIALCRARLARRWGARLGWVGAILVGLAGLAAAPDLEVVEGSRALLGGTLRWACWLGAGPLLLSAVAAPAQRDRREGITTLAALRGAPPFQLALARALAVIIEATLRLGAPVLVLALSLLAQAAARPLDVAGVLAAVVVAGALLGAAAAVCGEAAGRRGLAVFLAVVGVPWALADFGIWPAISLPHLVGGVVAYLAEGRLLS
ncbi:MAG: hypothetical protein KC731_33900 [Myxococcales bacterium]|nr:hypothetical protein [Myxococcales bacterium]